MPRPEIRDYIKDTFDPSLHASAKRTALEEDYRDTPYNDTRGKQTVGIGANISDPSVRALLPKDVQSGTRRATMQDYLDLYKKQYHNAVHDVERILGKDVFANLSEARKGVLVDMAFQMGGPSFSGFEKMIAALADGNFDRAAHEIRDSSYFRSRDTKPRATRNKLGMRQDKHPGGP